MGTHISSFQDLQRRFSLGLSRLPTGPCHLAQPVLCTLGWGLRGEFSLGDDCYSSTLAATSSPAATADWVASTLPEMLNLDHIHALILEASCITELLGLKAS